MKSLIHFVCIALLAIFCAGGLFAQPIEPIGGPYTVDTNTVLLLHFDGNLTNSAAAAGRTPATATPHTTNPSKIYFITNSGVPGMGQCVRLDNGAITDSTYLTLRDTAAFDMTGDWTIEAWVNIFTFGSGSNDYRWVPRVVMKPGQDVFWHPNYWLEMWGDNRLFHAGYYTPADEFISVTSENNMFVPGQWVHLTFIRDTQRGIIAQMIHNANRQLLSFTSAGFVPSQVPRPNNNDVHIGWAGARGIPAPSVDSWLDGFLDEIRISKVVRNFAGPPVVTNVTRIANQPEAVTSYPVNARAVAFNPGVTITSVMLHYWLSTTSRWDSVAMTGTSGNYTGTIPRQTFGTNVKYYVSAVDANGLRSTVPLTAERPNGELFSFWIFREREQVLWLTFDEGGTNPPVDHSPNPNRTIYTFNRIEYSTDRKQGAFSYLFRHSTPPIVLPSDSNWVEVASPFLAGEEFCLDVWMNSDSNAHATRIIHYPNAVNDWNNNNYEISIRNNASSLPAITGRYNKGNAQVVTQDTNQIVLHQWYHVIYERNKTNAVTALMVRNQNDQLLFRTSVRDTAAPLMGASVSAARLRVGRGYTDVTDWWFIPAFVGKLDNLEIYNYPKVGITGIGDDYSQNLPWKFDLSKNYPNPFNPSTIIRYTLPKSLQTQLTVYDMLGRLVRTLVNEERHAGVNAATWDGKDDHGKPVASGVYFYRLMAGGMSLTEKMMMLK